MTPEHEARVEAAKLLVQEWKPRLPWLDGWTIHVVPRPESENDDHSTAAITMMLYTKTAVIDIDEADPINNAEPLSLFDDLEAVILHELCHVTTIRHHELFQNLIRPLNEPCVHQANYIDAEEHAVWNIARALLDLKRSVQPAKRAARAVKPAVIRD